jgi:segregation and condensation protein A
MYRVRLDQFEGPLDLLLYFIRRDELDVYDIPIARITDEYLAYVRLLEQIDLDGAADFIYMAALLIQIKARMLFPSPERGDDGEPVDPRRELVERLIEYMRYKEAATVLERRWDARARLFGRGAAAEIARRAEPAEATYRVSLFDLIAVLHGLLQRAGEAGEAPRHTPRRYAYTLEDQQRYVLERVAAGPVSFVALVAHRSKPFVIVTFLAVLDLLRQQAVRLRLGVRAEDFAIEIEAALAPVAQAAPRERTREIAVERGAEAPYEPKGVLQP